MTDVTIPTPAHSLRGYLSQPGGAGPWPGVVVIHDVFGMSDDLRRHTDWLAGSGYLAVAPDLYSYGLKLTCVLATMRAVTSGSGDAFADIDAVRRWLSEQPGCTGRIGIIGFCLGGGFALQMAPGYGFAASGVNYGQGHGDLQTTLRGACPIVASYGGRDRSLPGAAAKLEHVLDALGIDHDVKEYPEAGHAFLNDHHGAGGRIMYTSTRPFLHGGYHAPSALDARRRILAFFAQHLRGPA